MEFLGLKDGKVTRPTLPGLTSIAMLNSVSEHG
jgi:hypothetical protein